MNINYENDTVGYLDITFGPKWDYVPLTKNYVENFLLINLIDKVNISKIALSASELLENAVKFSKKDGIRMMIKKHPENNEVELVVFNYADKKDADNLKNRINDMNSQEPLQYYISRMKQSVTQNETTKSGLGLARINYEGGAKIGINFSTEYEIIQVKAVFKLN